MHPGTSLPPPALNRVLVVEDEEKIAASICAALRGASYQVTSVVNGTEGLERAISGEFDLIILDVMLPGMTGFEVLKRLRDAGSRMMVLILTSRDGVEDRVAGLAGGADDYLTKPFYLEELLARTEALMRRAGGPGREDSNALTDLKLTVANVHIDRVSRAVLVDGKPVELTTREFDLLAYLMRVPGAVRPRAKIIKALWNYGTHSGDHVLDVYVGRLRSRLAEAGAPGFIETVRGVGFRVNSEPSA